MVGKYSVKNLLAHLRSGGSFTQPQHILRSVVSLRVGHQPLLFSLDDLCVIHAVFTSLLSRDLMYGWWTTFDIQLLMIPPFRIFEEKKFLIQISLTSVQVATDVWQAREYSTWKAHVHTNQRIPIPDS